MALDISAALSSRFTLARSTAILIKFVQFFARHVYYFDSFNGIQSWFDLVNLEPVMKVKYLIYFLKYVDCQ